MAEENAVTPDDEAARPESEVETDDQTTRAASSSEATAAAPTEILVPKERRARARAVKAAKTPVRKGSVTPEGRQEERDAVRAAKAVARRKEREQARAKYKAAEHQRQATPPREHVPGVQKVRQGVVVSDKADKTITVRIDVARRHRRYEKIVRTSNTVHAHDESNDAHTGDTVVVREARPLSRTKRWRLVEVVERAR